MEVTLAVDNIKCGGCANSIQTKLAEVAGITEVSVDIEPGLVVFRADSEQAFEEAKAKLASMGYPETGSVAGVGAMGAKAKSYVSCAIGKMTNEDE